MEVNRKAFKSLNVANSRRRPRAFPSCFTIIRNCWEACYESGIPLRVLVMEVNMMARRWSSLSRRGVRLLQMIRFCFVHMVASRFICYLLSVLASSFGAAHEYPEESWEDARGDQWKRLIWYLYEWDPGVGEPKYFFDPLAGGWVEDPIPQARFK